MNIVQQNQIYTYILEPGDMTRYRFTLQLLTEVDKPFHPGIDGEDYALVTILMGSHNNGGAIGLRSSFREPISPFLGYLKGHGMSGVNEFTLAAITLACSLLVDGPEYIERASWRMLLAPKLLAKGKEPFDLRQELKKTK